MDADGAHNLYDGRLRLIKPDGTYVDFDPKDYADYLGDMSSLTPTGIALTRRPLERGFSLDLDHPRASTAPTPSARINVANRMATPRARPSSRSSSLFGRLGAGDLATIMRAIEEVVRCELGPSKSRRPVHHGT